MDSVAICTEILGWRVCDRESKQTWTTVFTTRNVLDAVPKGVNCTFDDASGSAMGSSGSTRKFDVGNG
jgi:hypothetical protein